MKPNSAEVLQAIEDLCDRYRVDNIRADDDTTIWGELVRNYLADHNIKSYSSDSKFTNKNRVVDRVIRTIKDAIGLNAELQLLPSIVNQVVNYYNKTPHRAFFNKFTPEQAQHDNEIEQWFIRRMQNELKKAMIQQHSNNITNYKQGNVLMIHLPPGKTPLIFKKIRRNFNELAIFNDYRHGNVRVYLLNNETSRLLGHELIEVPIYYTQFVCRSIYNLPNEFRNYFNITD
jgi:hypothetical protein